MLVRHEEMGGVEVCRVTGELDAFGASEFREAAAGLWGLPRVVFDLSEVAFIDSCGLGALVGAIRRVRETGGEVVVCSTRGPITRLLHSVGLDAIVTLTTSLASAAGCFRSPAVA